MANLLPISFILHAAILGLASAVGTNYLLTGETLPTDAQLRNGGYTLIMQGDCNLVLYNGWHSNTGNRGRDCNLTLTQFGQLVITNGGGFTVWTGGPRSASGSYAAVVHPEGKVSIYGPALFTISPFGSSAHGARLGNIPMTDNFMFSGQTLYADGMLTARSHRLVMQRNCNLALYGSGGGWQSHTQSNTQRYCFLRLTHRGELVVKDDDFFTVWSSRRTSRTGDYVLIQQDNGYAVVYGPVVWSTRPSVSENEIQMVTVRKEAN